MGRESNFRRGLDRPTMREVAETAGVSISTVSRVLSDHPDVRPETRRRVQEIVEALGYRPSMLARALILKRTNTLGLVVSDITNPFYPELAKGIEDAARERGWVVVIGNSDKDGRFTDRYVEAMLERSVDGIIFSSVRVDDKVVPMLVEDGYPVVLTNRRLPGVETNMVIVDSVRGARIATEHLIGLGHRRIAHIGGLSWAANSLDRKQGYLEAMAGAGLDSSDELIEVADFTDEGGARAMHRLLSLKSPPTAVFASNDLMALGALEAIREAGLRCPEDLAVVGFDDIHLARSRLVQLTTVSHRIYDMGEQAVDILIRLITEGPGEQPIQHILEPQLMIRQTCGASLAATT